MKLLPGLPSLVMTSGLCMLAHALGQPLDSRDSFQAIDFPPDGRHPTVQTLTNTTYDEVMAQTEGLAIVWFYGDGTPTNEPAMLTELGPYTTGSVSSGSSVADSISL